MLGRAIRRANAYLDARDQRLHLRRLLSTVGDGPVQVDGLDVEVPAHLVGTLVDGTYEKVERELVTAWVKPGDTVLEVGGGLGVVSCLLARRAGAGHLTVVEPVAENAAAIRRNLDLNGLEARVVERLVAYDPDATIAVDEASPLANTAYGGNGERRRVPVVTLSELIRELDLAPDVVVMDAEGAEYDVIAHDVDALQKAGSTLIIEVHPHTTTPEENGRFVTRLVQAGYDMAYLLTGDGGMYHLVAVPQLPWPGETAKCRAPSPDAWPP